MKSASRTFHRVVVSILTTASLVASAHGQPAPGGDKPCELELLGRAQTRALDIALAGDLAYLATGFASDGLVVVDVSDPANPDILGSAAPDVAHDFVDVAVSGDFAYVADARFGLRVFDVSAPASPAEVGSHATQLASGVAIAGDVAYLADGRGSFRRFDVSRPSSAVELGVALDVGNARAVAVSGDIAYVGTDEGLHLINVTNPAIPASLGAYLPAGFFQTLDVVVTGDVAYVAEFGGLAILDVSDASNPELLGAFDGNGLGAQSVAVSGSRACLAVSGFELQGGASLGLQVVDVEDPADPTLVAFFNTPDNNGWGVATDGDVAYIGGFDQVGFNVVDLSCGPDCPGDVNGDGRVGILDLLTVISDFGCAGDCDGDTNGDDVVDFSDLLAVVGNYGCGFCETSEDCDDGDPCTIDFCVGFGCVNIPIVGCGW